MTQQAATPTLTKMTTTSETALRDWALLATRLVIVFVFLWHGFPKALDFAAATAKFEGFGLPGILGPIIGWAEVVLGLMILVGFKYRLATAALAIIIIGALVTVQIPAGGVTAGLERDLLILVATLVMIAYGPGRFALDNANSNA